MKAQNMHVSMYIFMSFSASFYFPLHYNDSSCTVHVLTIQGFRGRVTCLKAEQNICISELPLWAGLKCTMQNATAMDARCKSPTPNKEFRDPAH